MNNFKKADNKSKSRRMPNSRTVREQPRKDTKSKRVNYDNERVSKFEKDLDKTFARNDSNDIRWYSKNPQRVQSAGRIPFSSISGVTTIGNRDKGKEITSPGVMAIQYAPNFLPNSVVVEQAYQNMYSDIVHANSRNSSYDYTDLAIMHMAGIEVFAAIALGIRAYGLMTGYNEQNTYTPNALLAASGFNSGDLRANYSHMWDDLLSLIAQSRQIWLPNTMPIVERRIWMNLNVYKDDNTTKGQYYLYTPVAFYEYRAYTNSKGGFLTARPLQSSMTWSQYLSNVQNLIDRLIPDQDRGIMYGDILKAYGTERIFAMNEIGIDYKTIPTYNQEVLWQIENSVMGYSYPAMLEQDNLKFKQTWGLSSNPHGTFISSASDGLFNDGKNGLIPQNPMLNFHQEEQPTPEQIMVATRMTCADVAMTPNMATFDSATGMWTKHASYKSFYPTVSGTEVVTNIVMYVNSLTTSTGAMSLMPINLVYGCTSNDYPNEPGGLTMTEIFTWAAFDWAPAIYCYFLPDGHKYSQGLKENFDNPIMEYSNWTRISKSELERLHSAAVYSLYNVPTL